MPRGRSQRFRYRRRPEGRTRVILGSCATEEPQILEVFRKVWPNRFLKSNTYLDFVDCLIVFGAFISRKAGVFTNKEAVVVALEETLRYGMFLGTLAGTYVSVDEVIAALGGHKR